MQLQHPIGAVSSGVQGAALSALVRAAGAQLTRSQIAANAAASETGVRHALAGLVESGLVLEDVIGKRLAYRFNTEHLLAPAIVQLSNAKRMLIDRLRDHLETAFTEPRPAYAALFGSAARGEMRPDSDIDLFFVQPAGTDSDKFWTQCDQLAERVSRLTGNDTRPLILSEDEVSPGGGHLQVLTDILADGITLRGERAWLRSALASAPAHEGGVRGAGAIGVLTDRRRPT